MRSVTKTKAFIRDVKRLSRRHQDLEGRIAKETKTIARAGPDARHNRPSGVLSGLPVYKGRIPLSGTGKRGVRG